jgi:hypothetical protein
MSTYDAVSTDVGSIQSDIQCVSFVANRNTQSALTDAGFLCDKANAVIKILSKHPYNCYYPHHTKKKNSTLRVIASKISRTLAAFRSSAHFFN